MNTQKCTSLPTLQTDEPSRSGLVYHEVLADGLIHVGSVFGFQWDDRFVERVAALAWANGAHLVHEDVPKAAEISTRLRESLEVSRATARAQCDELVAFTESDIDKLAAIRRYYGEIHQTRLLQPGDQDSAMAIRQLVAEAALGGILCRGFAPDFYQAITGMIQGSRYEQAFLTARMDFWSIEEGLPLYHPFVELALSFYPRRAGERRLICQAIRRALPRLLASEDPWALEPWLRLGWKEGIVQAQLAPDIIQEVVIQEFDPGEREANLEILAKCINPHRRPDGSVDLVTAFGQYADHWNPFGFRDAALREANRRMMAARAFDFAVWMAVVCERPDLLKDEGDVT